MKIAIPATADGWNENIDDRFGRGKGFFVCDTDNTETTYIDNSENVDTGHGAGTSSAQSLVDAGIEVVISGRIGPKAGEVLKAGGVKVYLCGDAQTVKDAYERFQKGELQEASD